MLLNRQVRVRMPELTGDLLHYEEVPEALEYHQSITQSVPSAQNETPTGDVQRG
jgi:hypothetical protein